jgi:membrane protease YdiL (CAAX protease family)
MGTQRPSTKPRFPQPDFWLGITSDLSVTQSKIQRRHHEQRSTTLLAPDCSKRLADLESHVRQIVTFVALLIFLSVISNALLQVTRGVGGGLYMSLFMWTPGLAALITYAVYRRDVSSLGWGWHPIPLKALGYLLRLIYIAPAYVVTWIAIRGSFGLAPFLAESASTVHFPQSPRLATFGVYLPLVLTFAILAKFANTLGEELGWRGYLLPLLTERFGFRPAAFVTGIIRAPWHYPLLMLPGFITRPKSATEMSFFRHADWAVVHGIASRCPQRLPADGLRSSHCACRKGPFHRDRMRTRSHAYGHPGWSRSDAWQRAGSRGTRGYAEKTSSAQA